MAKQGRVTTALFCGFLAGMLLWHAALPDRERSETENRRLAQLPALSWQTLRDGSFTADIEDYFADQFPLRDGWTGLKARWEQLLGAREFHGVYLCGDTLIAGVEEPEENRAEKQIGYVNRFAELTEGRVLLGLIPTAAEIWEDRLPAGAPTFHQAAFIRQAAEETAVPSVDLLGALSQHAGEPIYYRTDHHWTTRGAFYGANALLEAMGKEPLEEADFAPEIASTDFNGTLYSTSGIHWLTPDTMEYWVPAEGLSVTSWKSGQPAPGQLYDRSYLAEKDKYSSFLGGNQPLCVIENPAVTDGSRILLIRDSYSDSLAPFLARRFSQVHLIDLRYYHASPADYMTQQGIDTAVVLYSTASFLTEESLFYLSRGGSAAAGGEAPAALSSGTAS